MRASAREPLSEGSLCLRREFICLAALAVRRLAISDSSARISPLALVRGCGYTPLAGVRARVGVKPYERRNMSVTAGTAQVRPDCFFSASLAEADPDIARAIEDERRRQQNKIELIASENIVSCAVLEAQGSVLTNKYAEGYPGRRYYGGCEFVDVAEELAIERA